jgi:hypothetical protein
MEINALICRFLLSICEQQIEKLYRQIYQMFFTPYMYTYIPPFRVRMGLLGGEEVKKN